MATEKGYHKLKVWQEAHKLVLFVYKYTEDFPRSEIYGLTSQLRRAAFSVPTNIVEGHASNSRKDFLNFLNSANKSLVEVEYLFEAARDLKFLNNRNYAGLEDQRGHVAVLLSRLIYSVRNQIRNH